MTLRVLVTGAAGFLGSHVCKRLVDEGSMVIGLDNLQTGNTKNLEALEGGANFTFVRGDIRSDIPDENYDEIWNLACPASPKHYQADPVDTMMINVLGMKMILDQARKCGARVFQASTSEVYGDPEQHPQKETYRGAVNSFGPRACYDEGKRAAETLCFDYNRQYGVPVKVVRIFNTFGPNMDRDDGRVVSNFIVSALKGEPLEIYGDGSQTRSFCFYQDLVDGFFKLMRSPESVTGPINIGNPGEFTINELADIVLELTNSKSEKVFKPLPVDDPRQRRPDISLAKELLDWEPKIALRAGLEQTISYFERTVNRV